MANKQNRYRAFEKIGTIVLIADAVLFLLFLIASGFGILWLKVITAIITILGSCLSLGYLFLTGELLRPRSLWMSTGFAAIAVCALVSVIFHYPSPLT